MPVGGIPSLAVKAWDPECVALTIFVENINAPSPGLRSTKRGVAQLVAYYVRDVGAGSSSLLTPT